MSLEEAKLRVERGAALLDERYPGWEHSVDLAKLDLSDSCRCILGQLFDKDGYYIDGGYTLGVKQLDLFLSGDSRLSARYFGFNADRRRRGVHFSELDEAWIALIKRRYDVGVFSDTA